jgi:hypothetical protein
MRGVSGVVHWRVAKWAELAPLSSAFPITLPVPTYPNHLRKIRTSHTPVTCNLTSALFTSSFSSFSLCPTAYPDLKSSLIFHLPASHTVLSPGLSPSWRLRLPPTTPSIASSHSLSSEFFIRPRHLASPPSLRLTLPHQSLVPRRKFLPRSQPSIPRS